MLILIDSFGNEVVILFVLDDVGINVVDVDNLGLDCFDIGFIDF